MESLNGHEAGNGGYGQGETYGNSPFLDPTLDFIPVPRGRNEKEIYKNY